MIARIGIGFALMLSVVVSLWLQSTFEQAGNNIRGDRTDPNGLTASDYFKVSHSAFVNVAGEQDHA